MLPERQSKTKISEKILPKKEKFVAKKIFRGKISYGRGKFLVEIALRKMTREKYNDKMC